MKIYDDRRGADPGGGVQGLIPKDRSLAIAIHALRPASEILALTALTTVIGIIYILRIEYLYSAANIWVPVGLAVILFASSGQMILRSSLTMWSPLFWFRVACAAYYGFGAVVPHIVDEATSGSIRALYDFTPLQNLKVNTVASLGVLSTLSFAYLMLPSFKLSGIVKKGAISQRTVILTLAFLSLGCALRYGIIVPYTFGLTAETLPGSFLAVAKVYYAGIFLLAFLAARGGGMYRVLLVSLVSVEIAISIASFSKTELLFILIFPLLGILTQRVTVSRLAVGALIIVVTFFSFQPLVSYGRDVVFGRYGSLEGPGLSERLQIVGEYSASENISSNSQQVGLSRLSYVNVGAFVIEQYDAGLPGATFENALAVLIPRALWPDKPIITQLGADLYTTVSNQTGSQLGVGHFAEAYWNYGWLGVPALMSVLALILCAFTRFSLDVMSRRRWLYLPVVFMGVIIGIRVDGHFVPDVIGPAWIAFVMGVGAYLLAEIGRLGTRSSVRRPGLP